MKLGPLLGKRTWGGVIGIWPRHLLADGGLTTQPEFAFWFEGQGWAVENYGVTPDIEVEYPPHDYRARRDPQLERAVVELMTNSGKKPCAAAAVRAAAEQGDTAQTSARAEFREIRMAQPVARGERLRQLGENRARGIRLARLAERFRGTLAPDQ